MKTKNWIWIIIGVIVLSLIIGNLMGVSLFGNSQLGGSDFKRFALPSIDEIKTSSIDNNVNGGVCRSEFHKEFGSKEDLICYIEDWSLTKFRFYNGDGQESPIDEDTVKIYRTCICYYN